VAKRFCDGCGQPSSVCDGASRECLAARRAKIVAKEKPAADPVASVLLDASGGRGRTFYPADWPGLSLCNVSVGLAGGITPSTVADLVRGVRLGDPVTWIDMESGVRTDDRFDLSLARDVLERVRTMVHHG